MAEFEPLTAETSAFIGAFIQELSIKAEGGDTVAEETPDLSMLAATDALPEPEFSAIRPLNHSDAPTTASANGDDKLARLAAILMNDTKSSEDQVASGQIPKAPSIVILPGSSSDNLRTYYQSLMDSSSMCQLYANMIQFQKKPEGFDITSEAGSAFKFQARAAYDAMMGPLISFFSISPGTPRTYNDTIPKDQVHEHLLGKLFDEFRFDKATKAALDVQLTEFVGGLAKIQTDSDSADTFDFMPRLNLVSRTNISGDDNDPDWIYRPTTYLIYMQIDAKTFRESINKNSGVDKVDFKFSLSVTECELDISRFDKSSQKFDKIFQVINNKGLRAYSELLHKPIQTNEPIHARTSN
ncbi:hypothetical protein G7Z17_g697 [Cylindrodendrum hubeiense]|uniref:Uncharacterized protein n=1 Tax=Cylindrodendrum hubeiense TaxID=595255 RepID=A0A9P5HHA6_9HYPO|nr:hypothetical protein G7Z17_g697 [Cylindrodendrum hubeiense]